ncbi:NCS2 family permease [Paenibacillus sp. N1-5-1-14]|uniref:NCS2 family permease n=1 Tax=Paenibacillus radicibacter TaxID=2972488 RepID=UPI002158D227|nr:NCS2 family permease [Paenibacillus radicibacter]MCR8642690.1 NCS2 family permease [Paenibacillus radicibacter]
MMNRIFGLSKYNTNVKTEFLAGFVSFITAIYIVVVNASILADAGIPFEAGIVATGLTSFVGCLIMGFWGNSPLAIVPGMGINALFTYTIVHGLHLSWQEALAVVFVSGVLFTAISFTTLSGVIQKAIPRSLKDAITAGIGLFITFIGLQKGGIVVAHPSTLVALGDLSSVHVLLTLATLIVMFILFVRNVPGNLLIGIAVGTVLAALSGTIQIDDAGQSSVTFADSLSALGAMSFGSIGTIAFWIATFSLMLVLVFENVGLIHGQLGMLKQPEKFDRSLQASAMAITASGVLGSSPTVSSVESTAGISAGGKTGLTAVTTGFLFLIALFFIPFIKMIPDTAIAPVLILVGGLMIQSVKNIPFEDLSEGLPAFLVLATIPLTSSIVDGMAIGFIVYPILKIATGKWKQVGIPLLIIAVLFLLNLVFNAIG